MRAYEWKIISSCGKYFKIFGFCNRCPYVHSFTRSFTLALSLQRSKEPQKQSCELRCATPNTYAARVHIHVRASNRM